MKLPEIIAEIGVNYYDFAKSMNISLIDAAKKMIDECKKAGIAIVKFQTYKSEKLAADYSPSYWDLNEEPTSSQKELFSKFDKLGESDFEEIALYCKKENIEFMSTPFDLESAEYINKLVSRHKIASADITNVKLMKKIASFKKPVLLSTGASNLEEIEDAVNLLNGNGCFDITLLHCVLSYPTASENANLWKIKELKKKFSNCKIGYSDHTVFSNDILLSVWYLGAEIIEKHFTLDRNFKGNDHYHAGDPNDFQSFIRKCNTHLCVIGKRKSWILDCEKVSRTNARRGCYLNRSVKRGDKFSLKHFSFLRPLLDGLDPKQLLSIEKKNTRYGENLKKGSLIRIDDINFTD